MYTIVQRHVLYLGEINDQQQAAWQKSIEIFEEGQIQPRTVALFPEDRVVELADTEIIRIITRSDVEQRLRDWADELVSSEEFHRWAERPYAVSGVEYADWEDGEHSVINEVLGALDALHMKMVIPGDVPIYLEFLATIVGQFATGYSEFRRKLDAIDYQARRRELRKERFYAPFL